jgi:hypothetical protein
MSNNRLPAVGTRSVSTIAMLEEQAKACTQRTMTRQLSE